MTKKLIRLTVLIVSILMSRYSYLSANDSTLEQGKEAYGLYCARCHGPQGKGDGVDAKKLYVAPRDLTSGRYKFKTTASGTPPSDEDLINNILGHGITGSGMPSFANLETDTKKSIVAYIKSMSEVFLNQKPQPIARPANEKAGVDLVKGKELYTKLQCALCHGAGGRANGTSAATLKDDAGNPLHPANLTQGWSYGGGAKPLDIYYRVMAGIEGAAMPSYDGAVTKEEAWALSTYVHSLQLDANWATELVVLKKDGDLPGLNDSSWDKAKRTDVILDGTIVQNGKRIAPTVNAISVQAIGNSTDVALKLTWDDPVKNDNNESDGFVLAFRPDDLKADVRANLHSLYDRDAPALDLTAWRAQQPDVIQSKLSNLHNASATIWNAEKSSSASASFEDGRWTVILKKSLSAGLNLDHPVRIGFSVWDGERNESLLRSSSSQWIWLTGKSQKSDHH